MVEGRLKVFRSRDYSLVRALLTDPSIFPHICDDFTKDASSYEPPRDENVVYLLALDDDGPLGLGIFHPRNRVCFEGHFGFIPRAYGSVALDCFRRMLAWMWQNTTARKVVGEIERSNRLAIRFAARAGFRAYAINQRSKLIAGVLRDQVCMEIFKPE